MTEQETKQTSCQIVFGGLYVRKTFDLENNEERWSVWDEPSDRHVMIAKKWDEPEYVIQFFCGDEDISSSWTWSERIAMTVAFDFIVNR